MTLTTTSFAPPTVTPFRWTRARYDQLAETGILNDTHCELLDGQIVEIDVTISPRHARTVRNLIAFMVERYGQGRVVSQQPIALGDHDEPEPDVYVTAYDDVGTFTAHPSRAILVIEVADASLRIDRTLKLARYAHAGVPLYWIVNLVEDQIETFGTPDVGRGEYLLKGIAAEADELWCPAGPIHPAPAPLRAKDVLA